MLLPLLTIATTLLALTHAAPADKKADAGKTRDDDLLVDLKYQQYRGYADGPDRNVWLGIRYAQAPLKKLRFRAPQKITSKSSKVIEAKNPGKFCLPTPSDGPTPGADEDCLFLHVTAPSDKSKKHPVFVFIQGGGMNGNASPNMNASHLLEYGENNIVVVNFNYRVGPWGFLASKEIAKDGEMNNGNRDQRAVLEWVRDHIDKFGGDPKKVTLGGASAGAASVNLQLTAFGGRDDGLFHAAAGESNSFGAQLTIEEAQYQYDALVKRVGCDNKPDTLKCLRMDTPIEKLIKGNAKIITPGGVKEPIFMYSNVIDKDFTRKYTYDSFNQDEFIKVPTIFGGDTNEGSIFTPSGKDDLKTAQDQKDFLKSNWVKLTNEHLDKINTWYNDTSPASQFPGKPKYWRTTSLAYGHIRYNCPGIFLSQRYATAGKHKAWHYHWDVEDDGAKKSGMGVVHTAEQNSIWGNAGDKKQDEVIGKYWTSFIRKHDVNELRKAGSKEWKQFDMKDQQNMHFVLNSDNNDMQKIDEKMLEKCAYFAKIGASIAQ